MICIQLSNSIFLLVSILYLVVHDLSCFTLNYNSTCNREWPVLKIKPTHKLFCLMLEMAGLRNDARTGMFLKQRVVRLANACWCCHHAVSHINVWRKLRAHERDSSRSTADIECSCKCTDTRVARQPNINRIHCIYPSVVRQTTC